MFTYTVSVSTGKQEFAETINDIYLTLVGTESCSDRTLLDKSVVDHFARGSVVSVDINVKEILGDIVLVKLEKEKILFNDHWYCRSISVTTPSGDCVQFPCYRWIDFEKEVVLRDDKDRLSQDDNMKEYRRMELESRQLLFRWKEWHPGFPMSIDANSSTELPLDIQFEAAKSVDFSLNYITAIKNLGLNKFLKLSSWKDVADFEKIFVKIKNTVSGLTEYVMQNWNKDYFFGYQFLNGCNPVVIRKCMNLPDKFAVTQEMVQGSLDRGLTLQEELKLLIPHVRFTIAINTAAREKLICKSGLFDKANGTGGIGIAEVIQKAMKTLTYKSLCFPEAMKARGVDNKEDLPNYYYRDDGMMVWEAVKSFVSDVVKIYYGSDETVQEDEEIQAFVQDVCFSGMKNCPKDCEFPNSLKTREQLVEYLTVVIFTASAQHAAVNFGQFDWFAWIPNSPSTMRKPPPTQKGQVDMKYIMDSLPDRGRSSWHLGAVWALSQYQDEELFLGVYPDKHFTEQSVIEATKTFRKKLGEVINIIKSRNEKLKLPYCYLSPDRIPNSVAI
ncbi:arachidonate 5-lipoxygenase-like isoform X3 [Sinocyclocheilus grahami]|uniref:arachidonate 5-lipoxygenase-like isoform X3 n=1 Tax=Sinocyclocheilus grahami TaxID=75366 RepID=UPI0007AD1BEA|nr:PREDICTED: arachidonate 5-lipoxygenase-like isoform X3 [Sinocyclocheilus grahami]